MGRPPEETTAWVASHHLSQLPNVQDVAITGPQTLRIIRDDYEPFPAGIVSATRVTPDVLTRYDAQCRRGRTPDRMRLRGRAETALLNEAVLRPSVVSDVFPRHRPHQIRHGAER